MALVATGVLLVLNGFFVGAEFALVAARRASLGSLAQQGNRRARWALRDVHDLSAALAGAQLGITMASLGLGFVAEPAIAHLLEAGLERIVDLSDGVVRGISIPVALTIVVYFHMVVGEMVPKNIAIAEPERATLALAAPFRFYMLVFRPVIVALNSIANGVLRLLGVPPTVAAHSPASGEDLAFLISKSRQEGFIEDLEHRLLTGALTFADRAISEVMIPRNLIVAAPTEVTLADLESIILQSGHTRIPLYRTGLDDIVGFVHAKDLLRVPAQARHDRIDPAFIRSIPVVPESVRLDPVLLEMRRGRAHLALVIDEHGATAGLVTLEDVIEELIGDIRDEHDYTALRIGTPQPGRFRVPGMLRIDEVERAIGLDLPDGDYDTLGGFVMDALGRVPEPGDQVHHDGWVLEVRSLDGRRVDLVDIVQPPPHLDSNGEE